jgi:hypothetical protein
MAVAGKVAITPRDDYQEGLSYFRLDCVRYNNCLYICKKDCTNIVPTNKTYWMLAIDFGTDLSIYATKQNLTTEITNLQTQIDRINQKIS